MLFPCDAPPVNLYQIPPMRTNSRPSPHDDEIYLPGFVGSGKGVPVDGALPFADVDAVCFLLHK